MQLTTMEKRAKNFCEVIQRKGSMEFSIEWKPSKTWGRNPSIIFKRKKICCVSGCGFDKLSQALADALRFLGDNIWQSGGCGESSVIRECEKNGWKLTKVACGKHFDAYRIDRMEGGENC